MHWWLGAFALLLSGLSGCLQSPAAPGPSEAATLPAVPDPLQPGPSQVTRLDYDFGYFVVDDPTLVAFRYVVPLHGSLHLPDGDGPFPVVALMHGRHGTCDYAGTLEFVSTGACPNAVVVEPVDSYTGYDGLAELLAGHGYAVASIDANAINDKDLAGDAGANARGALALRTLDELASVNQTGQARGDLGGLPATVPANTPSTDLAAAQGRLDLSRVGLMGHSRGGEGVARAVSLDLERHDGAHGLDAVFALAPTDFARWQVPGVAFATLLPYCDGDVYNLQGAQMYDDARRLAPAAPRHQVLAMGANHNYYNTVWTGDDWGTRADPWCDDDAKDSGRDTPDQQRAHGYGLMASFFRLYVGGEAAFTPLWMGAGSTYPPSLCPGRDSCEGRLFASAMPVHRLDLASDGNPPTKERLETESCTSEACSGIPMYGSAAVTLWDCHGSGMAIFPIPGAQGWTAVSMRVGPQDPQGNGLHVWVGLDGTTATLPALSNRGEPGSLAFPPAPGSTDAEPGAKIVMNEVRFPLPSMDLSSATAVRIHCDGDGGILVTDILLV